MVFIIIPGVYTVCYSHFWESLHAEDENFLTISAERRGLVLVLFRAGSLVLDCYILLRDEGLLRENLDL